MTTDGNVAGGPQPSNSGAREFDQACPEQLRQWLTKAVAAEASDLHVVSGYPPVLRVHGELKELDGAALDGDVVAGMLVPNCPAHAIERFRAERNADFALELMLDGQCQRFRANYFMSGRQMGACFRVIPSAIPDFQWAGFPDALAQHVTHFRNGLVLVCGVVGSGKTTSLAMMIHQLNKEGGYRIITVEEPVEYVFPRLSGSVVTQREVGLDVNTFADGLKYALRQDPDVILVGEIRDRATAQMALSAAETGHLVLSTLHTRDAKGAISRYADLFPQGDQRDVRSQLSLSLRAVISQHLLPSARSGEKRVLAMEVMFNNSAIGSAIRAGKIESIDNVILTGRADGMLTLDESIKQRLSLGWITRDTAERYVTAGTRL
jgi:twitching motility protein PilT